MNNKSVLGLRWGLLGAALLLLAMGLLRQEPLDVLQKAVKLCLECVGIG